MISDDHNPGREGMSAKEGSAFDASRTMENMAKVYSHPGVTHHFILDVTTSSPGSEEPGVVLARCDGFMRGRYATHH